MSGFLESGSDEIVISGISGRFPESANMQEFQENLFRQVNMVTINERRFKPGLYGIPKGFGTMKEIDKFDAEYFGVLPNQAQRMDPQLRMMLETTYEAMFDAGVNPIDERGTRTGVFAGVCSNESSMFWNNQPNKIEGVTMTGATARSIFANRISFAFDFKGPSGAYDTACSTSIFTLEAAISAMRSGKCDAAIVTASSLILTPHTNLQFHKLGMLSQDSCSKSFDSTGNGYARSEAVVTIYLQMASKAKRNYASIAHVKTNTDGYKDGGLTFPSASMQEELLHEVYKEAGVDPTEVSYVEAHGTGTAVGDPQEILALSSVFYNRTRPLLVGSVKSNMGHSEGASGLCGIAKILIMLQTGMIPANLHYNEPNFEMNSIRSGIVEVVDKHTKWEGGYIGLNSFGFGGVNTHVILKPCVETTVKSTLAPNLVMLAGKTEDGVMEALKSINRLQDSNAALLLNEFSKTLNPGLYVRGFTLWNSDTVEIANNNNQPGPVYFVFNGMGSQWYGMGKSLLQIPTFKKSICSSAETLEKYFGFDLMELIENPSSEAAFKNPTNVFTTIAAIQIALVDTLALIGIKPDGILGHSAGEIIAAYADECLTAEQTILCAYWRGQTINVEPDEYGMAAISLSWDQAQKMCPEGIYPACHNAADSVTISGPKKQLGEFIRTLKDKKIIAKEVDSCGVAFHSPYLKEASENLLNVLKEIIPSPKARSEYWISTSIQEENMINNNRLHSTASAEYIVNNFISPVLFYQALKKIPEKSTIIEIGPSGLLRGIIKRVLGPNSKVIALQARDSKDGLVDFMNALGQLYLAGVNVDVNNLYGEIDFPVPVKTSMLSPLVAWDHSISWDVAVYGQNGEFHEGAYDIDMSTEADAFLAGHQVQGRVLFPATGYMVLVWKFFAQMKQMPFEELGVVFEKIRFNRVTVLGNNAKVEFRVHISDISGAFEIKEGGAVICTGFIRRYEELGAEEKIMEDVFLKIEESGIKYLAEMERPMLLAEFYKKIRFLGLEYSGLFRGIKKCDHEGTNFILGWKQNWVSFLDTFLQTTFRFDGKQIHTKLPTEIGKLILNPGKLLDFIGNNNKETEVEPDIFVSYNPNTHLIKCHGVEAHGLKTTAVNSGRNKELPATLCTYSFEKYFDNICQESMISPTLQCMAIILENINSRKVKEIPSIIEFCKDPTKSETLEISKSIRLIFGIPDVEYNLYSEEPPDNQTITTLARSQVDCKHLMALKNEKQLFENKFDIIIVDNYLVFQMTFGFLRKGSFILLKIADNAITEEMVLEKLGTSLRLVAKKMCESHVVYLIRKDTKQDISKISVLDISRHDLTWVPRLRELAITQEDTLAKGERPPLIYLVSNGQENDDSGILGLVICLRKEPFMGQVRSIFTRKKMNLDFNNPCPILAKILANDLAINVIDENGVNGFYISVPINSTSKVVAKDAFVSMGTVGDFTTLNWVEGFQLHKLLNSNTEKLFTAVEVYYAALNFRDIMMATGNIYPEKRDLPYYIESPLGLEFAGTTENGDRVFGYGEGQMLATNVFANLDSLWEIPSYWTFEDAATIPTVYSTVYYALFVRGQLQQGESILIHSAAGGVGQAAIRVALSMNCIIFATVGSKEKREFIRSEFPQIPHSNIASSRDTDFEQTILNLTNGRGVDIVLNSLTGDKLEASVRCLANHGRFLEIGKVDLVANKSLGMDLFLKNASFHGIMLDSLWNCKADVRLTLKKLVQAGIDNGVIKPLPRRIYQVDQIEPCFRYMGQGKHIGKILVEIRNENGEIPKPIQASRRVYFEPNKSYIIVGGLGGFGLELINWMITRYAQKFVITTRSGVTDGYQEQYINQWRANGIQIKILILDASTIENARTLLQEATNLGPIGGFFNLAIQLRVGLMKYQAEEDFFDTLAPKINLSYNIDILARQMGVELDFFVLFSSIASAQGIDGQSNYGMANSALERLCEERIKDGLNAKAIQWGPIGEVGIWHNEFNRDFTRISFHGSGVQSIRSSLKCLDNLLTYPAPIMSSRVLPDIDMNGKVRQELSMLERIAHILGHANLEKTNPKSKLTELGMDSVMAMEVKQILEQDFGLALSAAEIRTCTLEQLTEMSKNSEQNQLIVELKKRAATADLFQLNFMKNLGKDRFLHKQCVYPLNQVQDKSNGIVFIVNSVEGPEILRILGSLLTRPAYAIQFAEHAPLEDILTLKDFCMKELRSTEPEGPYIIVGYSAGIFTAIELALDLETSGENKVLHLMDMTPYRFDALWEENFGPDGSGDEVEILVTMYSQVLGFDREELEKIMRSLPNREDQIKKAAELANISFGGAIDVELVQKIVSGKRQQLVDLFRKYKPSGIYKGKVVLYKTTQNLISFDSTEYWGLEEFCAQEPIVVTLDTTHSYMVAEPAVKDLAATINKIN